jgi:hypothetical protein
MHGIHALKDGKYGEILANSFSSHVQSIIERQFAKWVNLNGGMHVEYQ